MVCTPNKPEHARSRLVTDYNKMKEKYISKHQTKSMKTLVNMGTLDSAQKQASKNVTRLHNCLPETLATFCKKHLQALLQLDNVQDMFVEGDKVAKRKISTPFSSKRKHRSCGAALTKDTVAPVYKLITYLQKEAALTTEGLFRKTGNIGRQRQLKEQLQQGSDLQDTQYTVHDVTTVLKQLVSDLPQPLLMEKYFKLYLQIGSMVNEASQLKALQLMMVLLPQENGQVLKQLLQLLYRVAMIPENKMTASSLGIVFAPSLLCPRSLSASQIQADSAALSCVVSAMIKHAPQVFDFPRELVDDVDLFWKEMENPTKDVEQDLTNQDTDKVSDGDLKSDIIIMDQSSLLKSNTPHKTQMMLSKLYAHLRAMPQSAKKKKLLKQDKTTVKPSNIELGVKNEKFLKSKKLSKSLRQDLSTLINVPLGQCKFGEQISQS